MTERDLNLFILFFIMGTWTLIFWCQYLYPWHTMITFGVAIASLVLMETKPREKRTRKKKEEDLSANNSSET